MRKNSNKWRVRVVKLVGSLTKQTPPPQKKTHRRHAESGGNPKKIPTIKTLAYNLIGLRGYSLPVNVHSCVQVPTAFSFKREKRKENVSLKISLCGKLTIVRLLPSGSP